MRAKAASALTRSMAQILCVNFLTRFNAILGVPRDHETI
jgi:hypothetical protein